MVEAKLGNGLNKLRTYRLFKNQYAPDLYVKGKSQRTVMLDSYQITSVSVANNAAYDLFTGLR